MGIWARYGALNGLILSLSACTTGSPVQNSHGKRPASTTHTQQLAPVNLAKGECGLFVWAGEQKRFVLFSKGMDDAVYSSQGQEISLTPTQRDAEPDFHGQYPVQNFQDARGRTYDLSFGKVATLGQSIRYSQGSWRSQDDKGWERIEAAYGLSTCIPNEDIPADHSLSASTFDLIRPLGNRASSPPPPTLKITVSPASFEPKEVVLSRPAITQTVKPPKQILPEPPPPIAAPNPSPAPIAMDADGTFESSGPYFVQLASFLKEHQAYKAWDTLSGEHPSLTKFESHIIPAQIKNKGLYFRLQIGGFDSRLNAQSNCNKFKVSGLDCFVVARTKL